MQYWYILDLNNCSNMETNITLFLISISIAIIFGVANLIQWYIPRNEEKNIRPNLQIEILTDSETYGIQKPLGISEKNETISKGPDEDWYRYYYEWYFDLILRNNSDYNAFELKLLQHKDQKEVHFRRQINEQIALKAHENLTLPFVVKSRVEIQGKDREGIFSSRPKHLENQMLLFKYKNKYGKELYSRYYFNPNLMKVDKISEQELKEYWH